MDLGADAFKVKPYEVMQYSQLIQWLRSWLRGETGANGGRLLQSC